MCFSSTSRYQLNKSGDSPYFTFPHHGSGFSIYFPYKQNHCLLEMYPSLVSIFSLPTHEIWPSVNISSFLFLIILCIVLVCISHACGCWLIGCLLNLLSYAVEQFLPKSNPRFLLSFRALLHRHVSLFSIPWTPDFSISVLTLPLPASLSLHICWRHFLISSSSISGVYPLLICLCMYGKFTFIFLPVLRPSLHERFVPSKCYFSTDYLPLWLSIWLLSVFSSSSSSSSYYYYYSTHIPLLYTFVCSFFYCVGLLFFFF